MKLTKSSIPDAKEAFMQYHHLFMGIHHFPTYGPNTHALGSLKSCPYFSDSFKLATFFRLPNETLTDVWFWCINMFTFYICKYICKYINLHHASLTNFEFNLIPSGSMYSRRRWSAYANTWSQPTPIQTQMGKTFYSDLLIFSTTNTWWNHVVNAWCFSAFYVFTCKCIQSALHKKYISGYLFSKKSKSISLALFIAQNHKQIKIIKNRICVLIANSNWKLTVFMGWKSLKTFSHNN